MYIIYMYNFIYMMWLVDGLKLLAYMWHVGFMLLIPQITHTLWIWVASQRCVLANTFWSRCILGLFRSHPPEGSTWYWAKPTKMANAEHLTQQMINGLKWLVIRSHGWMFGAGMALVSRSTMHTESVLISQPVFASQLISWIPWFGAQTCEVDVVWKAFSGYLWI